MRGKEVWIRNAKVGMIWGWIMDGWMHKEVHEKKKKKK